MGKKSKSIRTRKTNPEETLAKQAAKEERAIVAARLKKQSDEDMRPDADRKLMRISGDEPRAGEALMLLAATSPLGPEHLPVQPFSTLIPVIVWETDENPQGKAVRPGPLLQHLRPGTAVSVVSMMTPGGVRHKFGDKVLGCMNEAFDNLCVPGGIMPTKSPPEAYRHGLGLIIINHVGEELPDVASILTPFYEPKQRYEHPVLKALIDPSCFDEKMCEVALAVAMRSWQKDDKTRLHTIVLALILVGTMDIWHSANPCSPGDRKLFSQLRKRVAKKKATACGGGEQMKALEGVMPVEIAPTEEEIALDEEFSELDFESLLAKEKGAGLLSF